MDIRECTNILDKLNSINSYFKDNNTQRGIADFEELLNEIQEEHDRLEAIEVGETLTVGYSMLTGREDYVDIVYAARNIGIDYIGRRKQELIEIVNSKIVELRGAI